MTLTSKLLIILLLTFSSVFSLNLKKRRTNTSVSRYLFVKVNGKEKTAGIFYKEGEGKFRMEIDEDNRQIFVQLLKETNKAESFDYYFISLKNKESKQLYTINLKKIQSISLYKDKTPDVTSKANEVLYKYETGYIITYKNGISLKLFDNDSFANVEKIRMNFNNQIQSSNNCMVDEKSGKKSCNLSFTDNDNNSDELQLLSDAAHTNPKYKLDCSNIKLLTFEDDSDAKGFYTCKMKVSSIKSIYINGKIITITMKGADFSYIFEVNEQESNRFKSLCGQSKNEKLCSFS